MATESAVPPGYANGIFDLKDRVAVVTGAGSGLGQAIAIGYAQVGVTVVLADVNMKGAQTTLDIIKEQGGAASVTELDVTKRDQVFALADKVVRDHGRVD